MKNHALLVFILTLFSCSNEDIEAPDPLRVVEDQEPTGEPIVSTIVNQEFPAIPDDAHHYFDWETTTSFPDGAGGTIQLPWSPLANIAFDPALRLDIMREDGWELLISEYTPGHLFFSTWFVFYNKYRGVIRFYYTTRNSSAENWPNNLLVARWFTEGSGRYLLNFSEPIIDLDNTSFSQYEIHPSAFSSGTWFMFEQEIGYDPERDLKSSMDTFLSLDFTIVKMSSLSILDKSAPSLPGIITIGKDNSSFLRVTPSTQTAFSPFLPSSLNSAIDEAFTNNSDAAVLNAQLGSYPMVQIPANVDLLVDLSTNALIVSPSFALPGSDQSDIVGLAPFYNRILGVFTLAQKPVIVAHEDESQEYSYSYTLETSTVEYLLNPAVTAIADIENVKQEIVAANSDNATDLYQGQKLSSTRALNILGVRVSFDVVPHNGSEPVRIVKTFAADVVSE
jgi:hypothetical protein